MFSNHITFLVTLDHFLDTSWTYVQALYVFTSVFANSSRTSLFCPTTYLKLSSWLSTTCQLLNHPLLSGGDNCSLTQLLSISSEASEVFCTLSLWQCHSATFLDSLLASTAPLNQVNQFSPLSSTSWIILNVPNISFTLSIWNYPLIWFFQSPCCTHLPLAPCASSLNGKPEYYPTDAFQVFFLCAIFFFLPFFVKLT